MFEIQFNSFEDFINFHNFQIIHAILAPIIYLFGIPSAMAFVYYEQNGGDPTKRSLQNILFAQVARSLAFYLFPGCFGFTWLIFFGPMNETLAWLNVGLRQFFETFGILYTTETMVIKVVMVYGWKYACCIDEAFFRLPIKTFLSLWFFFEFLCPLLCFLKTVPFPDTLICLA